MIVRRALCRCVVDSCANLRPLAPQGSFMEDVGALAVKEWAANDVREENIFFVVNKVSACGCRNCHTCACVQRVNR